MNAPSRPLAENEDFSIVLGGPIYQLYRKAHLAGTGLELLKRRIVAIPLFLWLPVVVLAIIDGRAIGGGRVPLLMDIGLHARCLLAIPLLVIAEYVTHKRLGAVARQFLDRNLIVPRDRSRYDEIVASSMRMRNSLAAEVIQVALAYAVHWVFGARYLQGIDSWMGTATEGSWSYTPAGAWYAFVTLPIFRIFLFRWWYRIFIWYRYLWKVRGLDLNLDALHPDRAAGLGFLAGSPAIFTPLLLAHSVLAAASIQNVIIGTLAAGKPNPEWTDFRFELAGTVAFLSILALTPLFFFGSKLAIAKRRANAEYGALASRYVAGFREKWLAGRSPADELVGSGDIQSLADLSGAYDAVRETRVLPITRQSFIQLIVISALPLLPLALNWVDYKELAKHVLGFLF
jgi:hypothetical protein